MAIVRMKKLRLMLPRSVRDELLAELQKAGCVEFSELEQVLAPEQAEALSREETDVLGLKGAQQEILTALAVLDRYSPQKTPLLAPKPERAADEFLSGDGLEEAGKTAFAIIEKENRIRQIAGEESRLRASREALLPWESLDLPLETEGTERCALLAGSFPAKVALSDVEQAVASVAQTAELFPVSQDKREQYALVLCLHENAAAMQEALRPFGWSQVSFSGQRGTPRENIAAAETQLQTLRKETEACEEAIRGMADAREALKLAADRYEARIAGAEAGGKLYGSGSVLLMQGWIPAEKESALTPVFERFGCAWETEDPAPEEYDDVPVQLKNGGFAASMDMVTNMYSLPRYGTVDANPYMAPFFILIYGLMFADMGYGLLMIIAAIVAMRKIRPKEGTLSFCRLLLYGGIATFVCGALTGAFFGDVPLVIAKLIDPDTAWTGLPALFSPIRDSNMVLYGSLVLGVIHMNVGVGISLVGKCRRGEWKDALFNEGALWIILIGGIVMGIPYLLNGSIGSPVVLIIGAVLLLAGSVISAKGAGKITAPVATIYNTVTGWFGDVLSYSRIMALMLAGGVVGQVFNTIAAMPAQSMGLNPVSILAFVVIFVLGHAINFGLNILGCFVHDLRLQCLEFFGKFYTEGGRAFDPLHVSGKFARAKDIQ